MRFWTGLHLIWIAFGLMIDSAPCFAGETLDRVLSTGEILAPYPDTSPPYVLKDHKGGLTGFDVEVLGEIARRLGVQVRYVTRKDGANYSWDEQTAGRWEGKYDIVVNSITPTDVRAQSLEFPAIYYYALGVLTVHLKDRAIQSLSDASGKHIGALKGTNDELYLRREAFGITGALPAAYKIDKPAIATFDTPDDAFEALERRELDGVVSYLPEAIARIKKGGPYRIVDQPLYRLPQAVTIMPGDPEFADLLRKIVDGMREDGTLRNLSARWFEYDFSGPETPGG